MSKKIILHLCADIGSDSRYYDIDDNYEVIKIGESIGVENYIPPKNVHGVIANPVCTEFSTVAGFDKDNDLEKGMIMVNHCFRIIAFAQPKFWVMENPNRGKLKSVIGKPSHTYQPWQYGSAWTKDTALWGNFTMPAALIDKQIKVNQIPELWVRKGRSIACLTYLHKSAIRHMKEYEWCAEAILSDKSDSGIRSLCSDGFARAFKQSNV
jgi:hypothetical protein